MKAVLLRYLHLHTKKMLQLDLNHQTWNTTLEPSHWFKWHQRWVCFASCHLKTLWRLFSAKQLSHLFSERSGVTNMPRIPVGRQPWHPCRSIAFNCILEFPVEVIQLMTGCKTLLCHQTHALLSLILKVMFFQYLITICLPNDCFYNLTGIKRKKKSHEIS